MEEKTTESGAPHTHGPGCFFCTTAMPVMGKIWSRPPAITSAIRGWNF